MRTEAVSKKSPVFDTSSSFLIFDTNADITCTVFNHPSNEFTNVSDDQISVNVVGECKMNVSNYLGGAVAQQSYKLTSGEGTKSTQKGQSLSVTFRYESFDVGSDPSADVQTTLEQNSVDLPICFGWKKLPHPKKNGSRWKKWFRHLPHQVRCPASRLRW